MWILYAAWVLLRLSHEKQTYYMWTFYFVARVKEKSSLKWMFTECLQSTLAQFFLLLLLFCHWRSNEAFYMWCHAVFMEKQVYVLYNLYQNKLCLCCLQCLHCDPFNCTKVKHRSCSKNPPKQIYASSHGVYFCMGKPGGSRWSTLDDKRERDCEIMKMFPFSFWSCSKQS